MAARGARAARGQAYDDRIPGRECHGVGSMDGCFCRPTARAGLDRRSHRRDRVSLDGRTPRARCRIRGRIGPPQARRHRHQFQLRSKSKAGDIGHPYRLCVRKRSTWERARRQSGPTGRQCHGPVGPASRYCWQATRTLGLEVAIFEIRRAEDIAPAFEALKNQADALYVVVDALVTANRTRIMTFALTARLPMMLNTRDYVQAGALISYGPNFPTPFPARRRICGQDSAWHEARRNPGR